MKSRPESLRGDTCPTMVLITDQVGRVAFIDPSVGEWLGYQTQQLIGQELTTIMPQLDADVAPGVWHDAEIRLATGHAIYRQTHRTILHGASGSVTVVWRVRPGSGNQAAHTELLASIIRSSSEAIVTKTPEGVITSWNEGAERLYGYDAASAIGRTAEFLFPPEAQAEEVHILTKVAHGETVKHHRLTRLRSDRGPVTVELTASPLRDGSGHVVGVLAVSRDIEELARTQERFREFLVSAPDAIIAVRSNGKITFANQMATHLFDYEQNQIIGQPVEILIPEYVRDRHQELRDQYFMEPRHRAMNAGSPLWGRRADGSTFPAEISLNPVTVDDGVVTLASIRDRTEWLAAQNQLVTLREKAAQGRVREELMRNQRLDSLGQLASGIAHDFNNLLGIIANHARLIVETTDDNSPDLLNEIRRDANQIVKSVDRGERLTRQLLTFGRRDPAQPEICDLNSIIDDVVAMLERTLGNQVRLRTALTDGLPAVLADQGQIEQIVLNLAVNARDAMPTGGELTISTHVRHLDADFRGVGSTPQPGRYAGIDVTDTGTGIPPDLLRQIFDPFFTTKGPGKGTGLGLAMVYGIVAQSHGALTLRSAPGAGTTFTVLFPAADTDPEPPDAVAQQANNR